MKTSRFSKLNMSIKLLVAVSFVCAASVTAQLTQHVRVGEEPGSDNEPGAGNQQETSASSDRRILRDHTSDIRVARMMIWSHLHGDMQERSNVMAARLR